MIGMGTDGTTNEFRTQESDRTGRAGIMITIGKGEELGGSTTINLDHHKKDRNSESKGNGNITRGLGVRDMSNEDGGRNIEDRMTKS